MMLLIFVCLGCRCQVKCERLTASDRVLRGKILALESQVVIYRDKLARTIHGG